MMKTIKKGYNGTGNTEKTLPFAKQGSGAPSSQANNLKNPYEDGCYHGAFFYPERK